MKTISLGLCIGIFMVFNIIMSTSCGDDEGDDGKNSSDADSDSDGDGDSDSDSDSEGDSGSDGDSDSDSDGDTEECGGENQLCCEGATCEDGLDPVGVDASGTCMCLIQCTYNTCAAGNDDGYCGVVLGTETVACLNVVDIPMMETAPNCDTVGESCTTETGATEGTECIETMAITQAFGIATVNRCVVLCDDLSADCDDSTTCIPGMDIVNQVHDYTKANCYPNSILPK